jgi:hypothetical protein
MCPRSEDQPSPRAARPEHRANAGESFGKGRPSDTELEPCFDDVGDQRLLIHRGAEITFVVVPADGADPL